MAAYARAMTTSIAVVVPTYRRPELLRQCLTALVGQDRAPDEVIAVARPDDVASREVAASFAPEVQTVAVHEPGFLAALTAGARATTADVVAFTDDDAEPMAPWCAQLLDAYRSSSVGGVGGRDLIAGEVADEDLVVGRVTSWGKLIGNHSRGAGAAREVDVLKGVNMSFRREALALPTGYRGSSTQAHTEVAIGLWARSRGWRVVYDPSFAVVHHEAPRVASVSRERWRPDATSEAAYNLVAGMLAAQPERALRRGVYGLAVGDRGTPGVARAAASLLRGRRLEAAALPASLRGQAQALLDARRGRGASLHPVGAYSNR